MAATWGDPRPGLSAPTPESCRGVETSRCVDFVLLFGVAFAGEGVRLALCDGVFLVADRRVRLCDVGVRVFFDDEACRGVVEALDAGVFGVVDDFDVVRKLGVGGVVETSIRGSLTA